MFRQQRQVDPIKDFTCPECKSKRFVYKGNRLDCTNCDYSFGGLGKNKFGAKRTEGKDGLIRDSKFEAGIADQLFFRKQVGDIKDYDSQFKVEMWAYRKDGLKAFSVKHKVDFRIHHKDGSYELLEAKGAETADYRMRRRFLEELWLPEHPDHTYKVVRQ